MSAPNTLPPPFLLNEGQTVEQILTSLKSYLFLHFMFIVDVKRFLLYYELDDGSVNDNLRHRLLRLFRLDFCTNTSRRNNNETFHNFLIDGSNINELFLLGNATGTFYCIITTKIAFKDNIFAILIEFFKKNANGTISPYGNPIELYEMCCADRSNLNSRTRYCDGSHLLFSSFRSFCKFFSELLPSSEDHHHASKLSKLEGNTFSLQCDVRHGSVRIVDEANTSVANVAELVRFVELNVPKEIRMHDYPRLLCFVLDKKIDTIIHN